MRKWTYLVATLLMAGAVTTFTGCIDTDEPEGITNLRGAKAELIKAQSALKLVDAEYRKAEVANKELQNKALELENKMREHDVAMKAIEVKIKELGLEMAKAQSEADKARLQAEIAASNKTKADSENAMAKAAEEFKAEMLFAQEQTARAQASYEVAMQDIELAKLTMSADARLKVEAAQTYLTAVTTTMNGKYTALNIAQTTYYNALTSPTLPTEGSLKAALLKAEAEAAVKEAMFDKQVEMLALAQDFDAVAWDKKMSEYKKQISEYESEKGKAALKEQEIKNTAEYKAADANSKAKAAAKTTADLENSRAKSDADNAMNGRNVIVNGASVATLHSIKAYSTDAIDPSLKSLFGKINPFSQNSGYNVATGKFSYMAGSYKQGEYVADQALVDQTTASTVAAKNQNAVAGWIKVLGGYTVDDNGVEWGKIGLKVAEGEAATAKKSYDDDKAVWDMVSKAFKTEIQGKKPSEVELTVPTKEAKAWDLDASVKAYNDNYQALKTAIDAYKTKYDSEYKAANDKYIADWKAVEVKKVERDLLMDKISSNSALTSAYNSLMTKPNPTVDEQIAAAKTVLQINSVAAPGQGAINDELDARYTAAKAVVEAAAKAKGLAAASVLDETAVTTANAEVKKTLPSIDQSIIGYKNLASYPYAQALANPASATIQSLTGSTGSSFDFYTTTTPDANGKVYYALAGKGISTTGANNDFAKLIATNWKSRSAIKADLKTATSDAFGLTIPTTGEDERLEAVTEKMVRDFIKANPTSNLATSFGKLGVWMAAKDKVQYYTDLIKAGDQIKALIVQLESVKTSLKAEIDANTAETQVYVDKASVALAALAKADKEVTEAKDALAAITAAVKAETERYASLITDMDALVRVAQSQIGQIATAGGATGTTVAEILNYWKKEVADATAMVEIEKQKVAAAKKAIELFNKGEYTEAYKLQQVTAGLKVATDNYDTAKAVYSAALRQLQALIDALAK